MSGRRVGAHGQSARRVAVGQRVVPGERLRLGCDRRRGRGMRRPLRAERQRRSRKIDALAVGIARPASVRGRVPAGEIISAAGKGVGFERRIGFSGNILPFHRAVAAVGVEADDAVKTNLVRGEPAICPDREAAAADVISRCAVGRHRTAAECDGSIGIDAISAVACDRHRTAAECDGSIGIDAIKAVACDRQRAAAECDGSFGIDAIIAVACDRQRAAADREIGVGIDAVTVAYVDRQRAVADRDRTAE